MKKQLSKKLYAFIFTAMMFSASANAQIVYTDVNPDVAKTCSVTSSSGTCSAMDSIDINNDGVFDLKLELSVTRFSFFPIISRSGFVKVSPLHGSAIRTDNSGYPLYMNLNDVISTSGSASMASGQILISRASQSPGGSTTTSGNWITATDRFLGLKIVSGSQSYYCWVRLNVSVVLGGATSATFRIKDYAYNSIPYQAILAGQTTATGINENSFASSINFFPNPASNQLTISPDVSGGKLKIENVTIYDLTGREVYTENHQTPNSNPKIIIDVSKFPEGVYVVQIQTADFIGTKKLVIEK